MVKVKKVIGEYPIKVAVLAEEVDFDNEGVAEVSEEVAEVLATIPGYEVEVEGEEQSSETDEAEVEEKSAPAPKKPTPRKPAPKK